MKSLENQKKQKNASQFINELARFHKNLSPEEHKVK
jgi:hypothetical protein